MSDFTTARVGDKLYSLLHGEVKVKNIDRDENYPILVISKKGDVDSFTSDGRYYRYGDQVLFWAKPQVIAPPMPPRKVEIDEDALLRQKESLK